MTWGNGAEVFNNEIIQVLENQQLSVCPKRWHNYTSWACAICLEDNSSIQGHDA